MMRRVLLYGIAVVLSAFMMSVKAETYVVSVGIANYQNLNDLTLAENDAKVMAKLYKTRTKNVITMTGKYATRANILKALNDQFGRAKQGDMVVFFFSGHGYEGGFCPYDMGGKNRNALTYEDIYAVFRKSKATRKIVVADACMSGGLRKASQSRHQANGSDVVMFLSSRTNEYSIEGGRMKNGIFTTYVERGLRGGADTNKDRLITAKEIFVFVSDGVQEISRNRQHPVMWGNFDDEFVMVDWRK